MVANAVYSLLAGDAAVSALVGTRVYPNVAPQNTAYPHIVYQLINVSHIEVLAGSFGNARSLVQVSCRSHDYDEARDLAEKCRLVLQGYAGTAASIEISGVNLVDDRDIYDPPRLADEPGTYGVQLDFAVWNIEAIPA